ncbi:lysophospholipase [Paenibacillus sp. N4]|uniref:alpha/beta hydrolase n=1 Tax=Paenibacillus vietnamensis TaxID=2590547 RepID=UPI001CD12C51|nr:alpha/beta hydrolase [Paenibacillus vietnamensis]MCA0756109.1 lysophospholipase [Paenibacillus vietnamensis]
MLREEWLLAGMNGASLFAREWKPDKGEIRAAVCIIHGMGEHGDRYTHVAELLTESGYAALALDQLGHGRSPGKRGHLGTLEQALGNAERLVLEAARRHPGTPVFLYGHSMGGNVALNCALRREPMLHGLILTSPWLRLAFKPNPTVEWIGRKLASIVPSLQQETGLNPADLFRPGYAKAAKIVEDLLCHTKITLSTYKEITDGGEWALANAQNLRLPVLLMHGSADRITSAAASAALAETLGPRCDWKIWEDGRHELHNDLEGEKAVCEIGNWIRQQLSK